MSAPQSNNQDELIQERSDLVVYDFRPGITGLAHINKIDICIVQLLAKTDAVMIQNLLILLYFKLIFLALLGNGLWDRVVDNIPKND